jgi:hypothetical protein
MTDKETSILTPQMMEKIRDSARRAREGLEAETDQDLEIALATEAEILFKVRTALEKEWPCLKYGIDCDKRTGKILPLDEKDWCPNCRKRKAALEEIEKAV